MAPTTDPRFQIQTVDPAADALTVTWSDGHRSRFHHVWLRHNCPCPQCSDPKTDQKLIYVESIPANIVSQSASLDPARKLLIVWSGDSHRSTFDPEWLRAHCYSRTERRRRRHRPILWGAELAGRLPEIAHETLVSGDEGRLAMLSLVRDYGFGLVRGVPAQVGELEKIAVWIGPLRETNYGQVLDVRIDDSPKIFAYTSKHLSPHTDDPYRYWPPNIGLFHCLEANPEGGGLTMLVDGLNAAEALRQQHPEAFELLARVPMQYRRYHPGDEDIRTDARMISVSYEGVIQGIRFADRPVAPLDLPEELVEPFYSAFREFASLLRDADREIRFGLGEGDVLVFDNQRVLHGRTGFNGRRHLRTCYVERESLHSRLRVLSHGLRPADADMKLTCGAGT